MQAQVTPLDGSKAIGITFTDKPVTAFGGLALFVAFAERIGLGPKLAEGLPFVLTSPNATPPHHIVLPFPPGGRPGAPGAPVDLVPGSAPRPIGRLHPRPRLQRLRAVRQPGGRLEGVQPPQARPPLAPPTLRGLGGGPVHRPRLAPQRQHGVCPRRDRLPRRGAGAPGRPGASRARPGRPRPLSRGGPPPPRG